MDLIFKIQQVGNRPDFPNVNIYCNLRLIYLHNTGLSWASCLHCLLFVEGFVQIMYQLLVE
jgi:hypothetical protein